MSSEIVDFDKYKSVKSFRSNNLFYKRKYLDDLYFYWEDSNIEQYFSDLEETDLPLEIKKEQLVNTFWFYEIVSLIDFLNPIRVTYLMAKNLCFYELLSQNIKYSENKDEKLYSKFKQLDPKSFDWELDELINYQFIVSL